MRVEIAHGSGGERMAELIDRIVSRLSLKSTPGGRGLDVLEDSGIIEAGGVRLALTTDTHTVSPLFFPGGDIGKLSFCGTVNDLAVMGAEPLALSLGLVIEEGFELSELDRIIDSINGESLKHGVPVVAGDTKVMERGKLEGLTINTSGVGLVRELVTDDGARPGDRILVSGTVGDHGMALLARRFGIDADLESDCRCILEEVRALLETGGVRAMKDPTRGGLAAALNELAGKSGTGFHIDEGKIPVREEAMAIEEILGVDPLQTACEGRLVAIVSPERAGDALRALKRFNRDASIIGEVRGEPKGRVVMETVVGGRRFLESAIGELYPRIC